MDLGRERVRSGVQHEGSLLRGSEGILGNKSDFD